MAEEPVVFASDQGARLSLRFLSPLRLLPDREDFVEAEVEFSNAWLRAAGRYSFFGTDVWAFIQDLAGAQASLKGYAVLRAEDGDFQAAVRYGDRGDVTIAGELRRYEDETVVSFTIESDQSFVNSPLAALRALA